MAFKFEIVSNALVVTNTDNSSVMLDAPKENYYPDNDELIKGYIVLLHTDKFGINDNIGKILISGAVDSDDVTFTETTFRAFARQNLGFKTASGGSGATTLDELTDVDTDKSKTPADGDVLTFDGTDWNAETPSGGGGAFSTTSNVTSNATGDYATDDFVFGSPSLDDDADATHDYRFLFDKSTGAFRAGRATGTEWNTRGNFSVGFGNNCTPTGNNSIAMGVNANASSDDAIALGENCQATEANTVAIGLNSDSTTAGAVSLGQDNTASGANSVAIGRNNTASQSFATAIGQNNTATGQRSLAAGNFSTAQAYNAAVFGRYNELLGSTTVWTSTDPVVQVGIGTGTGDRKDAFRILKDGVILAPEVTTTQIDSASNKALVTKEWVQNADLGTKNWSHFGDSTSDGAVNSWVAYLDNLVNFASVDNNAVSGDTIANQVADLDTLLVGNAAYFEDYEIASILIGINDFNNDNDLGTRTSTVGGATVAGQMRDWIEKVLTSNPLIQMYVITPWEKTNGDYESDNAATIPWSVKDLRQLYHEICTDYQIQCIDLYTLSGINSITGASLTDGVVHLNAAGYTKISEIMRGCFVAKNNTPIFS